ncbi:ABC transporter ATP-binding protein [Natrarchaeobius chitinivorans]|uniref:ABC transporter ATP-binding protein n=1 Tax=Natrarchaeobius chitinivorans TaxID=1679083 RepID=A0A3N6NA50_NATCH|nr:ABC transporter ATP-binding protein [Natrarchaeobius chitinivorans]RQG95462.1 ABC transporter ATP-binding protein [Natrarchaeobius chitinivorans]
MTEPILEVKNLTTSFSTDEGELIAVDDVSFTIDRGEIFGIVGESGSGKSVTALSILQLIDSTGQIDADEILFDGEDLLSASDEEIRQIRGSKMGMIFQNPSTSLNPVLTVGEQIAEVVRHHGDVDESDSFWREMGRKYVTGTSTQSPSWKRAVSLLEKVGIPAPEERAKDYPHQLSGGMKQRAMIAQALAADPELIIADEPTTALDVTIEAQILAELENLREEFDVSIIFITHDLGVIREICDNVTVMYAGEVMEAGDVRTIIEDPWHPYTQDLIACIPRLSDDREWLTVSEGNVPSLVNKEPGCPYRYRCDYEFGECTTESEKFAGSSANHQVKCHLHDPEHDEQLATMERESGLYDSQSTDSIDGGVSQ